jgi:hypothetical protein
VTIQPPPTPPTRIESNATVPGFSSTSNITSPPQQGEEAPTNEPHFEPVIKLTEQVEVKTNEENEDVLFKM